MVAVQDFYGVNAAASPVAGPSHVAPDAGNVGGASRTNGSSASISWVAMVATLVVIRVLWEMSE